MGLKTNIFINLFILSFEIFEIKVLNINKSFKYDCSTFINKRDNGNKIKIFKKDKKLIKEKNSCVNDSLCRG